MRGSWEESLREGLRDSLRESLREGLRDSRRESLREGLRDSLRESLKESFQETFKREPGRGLEIHWERKLEEELRSWEERERGAEGELERELDIGLEKESLDNSFIKILRERA